MKDLHLEERWWRKNDDIEKVAFMLCRGGWPLACELSGKVALRRAFAYLDAVVKSDISRVDGVKRDETRARRLMRSYARLQGTQSTLSVIREDLSENEPATFGEETISSYLGALRKIFVIEDMPAWCPNLRSKAVIRTADFARSPKVRKQLKAYLESPDRADPDLAKLLPSIVTKVPRESLRVCEAAVQLELWRFEVAYQTPCVQNVWDKNVEVEKSSYLWTNAPVYLERKRPLKKDRLNVLELFCGCGGTSCGFEMAGYQTVLGVDVLEPAIATFHENHVTAGAFLGDIRKVSAEEILKHVDQPIDVVIAGIPCQGFSLNNRKRHDSDARNTLYLELLRILKTIRPRAVVVENVSGIRSSNNGQVVSEIEKGIFDVCGLTVRHQLLNAADYGVPQRRARVVFVGVKDSKGFDFDSLKKTNGPGTGRPYVTIREAIGDLPVLESGQSTRRYTREPDCDYQWLMRDGSDELFNHSAPTHPQETIDKIAHTKPGEPMYPKFQQRIRLAWDIQSPTQVSGGIRPQFQFGHPDQARGLTIRERCRIQSFPDLFHVAGGLVQGRVQTGNAVPPLLAKAIATALRKYLQGGRS